MCRLTEKVIFEGENSFGFCLFWGVGCSTPGSRFGGHGKGLGEAGVALAARATYCTGHSIPKAACTCVRPTFCHLPVVLLVHELPGS